MKKPRIQRKREASPLMTHKVKMRVVGIGGGGASIVSELATSLKGVSFLVADTDEKVLKKVKKGIRTFQFGQRHTGGMGTGMNPELAKKAALEEKEKIARALNSQDLVILIGSLGGGVASGAGPVFANQCLEQKNVSIGIFTLPFAFEGEKKMKIAKKALLELQECLSGVIIVPNEKIFHLVDKKTPLKKSLSALNKAFADWLNDLIAVISKPGLINIDFADLKTILSAKGKALFFGQGAASGPTRAEEVVKNIFQNPFAEGEPKRVRRILFNIAGGKDLGLKEVETISNQIAKLNPKAKIIFGISEEPASQGKVKITLLCVSDTDKSDKSENRRAVSKTAKKAGQVTVKLPAKKLSSLVHQRAAKGPSQKTKQVRARSKTRRTALEVKKEEKEEETREWAQEPDWEVPAFLRKVL